MIETETYVLETLTDSELDRISKRMASGAIAVFATDTVYGIGCSASCPAAVTRVFAVKHRDASKPLPIFVPTLETSLTWIDQASHTTFRRLAQAFWPGALTIVSDVVRPGLYTRPEPVTTATVAGFRVPRHAGLLRLLSEGLLLAQTSFNESGEPVLDTLTSPEAAKLLVQADFILDSRQRPLGRPSTVIRVSAGSWSILREGSISAGEIASVIGAEEG